MLCRERERFVKCKDLLTGVLTKEIVAVPPKKSHLSSFFRLTDRTPDLLALSLVCSTSCFNLLFEFSPLFAHKHTHAKQN